MMSRDAVDLHSGWSSIECQYERLWNHLDEPGAEAAFQGIYESAEGLSTAGTKFPYRRKRLAYWLDRTAETAVARYA
jgi:hypothetical protein